MGPFLDTRIIAETKVAARLLGATDPQEQGIGIHCFSGEECPCDHFLHVSRPYPANGHTLRPETVRSYWKRARLIVIKQRAATPRPSFKFPKPAPAAPESPSTPPEPKFKFAKMRNGGLGVSAEELRALGDPSAPADPNDPRWQIPSGSKPSGS